MKSLSYLNDKIYIFFTLQMPILDIGDDQRNSSRPESESDFEEIHPGESSCFLGIIFTPFWQHFYNKKEVCTESAVVAYLKIGGFNPSYFYICFLLLG